MKNLLVWALVCAFAVTTAAQKNVVDKSVVKEVVLNTATGQLAGTLLVADSTKRSPIVLIVAGSGPTDRNCNSPLGIQTNAYKMLAEELAKRGISSLRYDKRGIGKSQSAMASEKDLRFETYANDIVDWVLLLNADKRFTKIVLLGHSEGSLLCILAAQKCKADGVVSVAGAGKSIDKILVDQLRPKLPSNLMAESLSLLDSLRAGKTVPTVNPNLMALFRPSVQPYMISWIKYDPAVELARLKIPVLIVQGKLDLQVSVEDAQLLSVAKPKAKLLLFDHMNHVLKACDTIMANNLATYRQPSLPLAAGLSDSIADFVRAK